MVIRELPMLLEVSSGEYAVVLKLINEELASKLRKVLPFKAELNLWKEEVYFEIPGSFQAAGRSVVKARRGGVYYWNPGRALCVFYGISEPYSEVVEAGFLVGPSSMARRLPRGEAQIKEHVLAEELKAFAEQLAGRGFAAATPRDRGKVVLAVSRESKGELFSAVVCIEDYGVYVESDGIFKYDESSNAVSYARMLKRYVQGLRWARVDLSEEGYLCITAAAPIDRLIEAIEEVEAAYSYAMLSLG